MTEEEVQKWKQSFTHKPSEPKELSEGIPVDPDEVNKLINNVFETLKDNFEIETQVEVLAAIRFKLQDFYKCELEKSLKQAEHLKSKIERLEL